FLLLDFLSQIPATTQYMQVIDLIFK
ncbi:hypothetical protein A4X03_0g5705, partial [Tilletia caries]